MIKIIGIDISKQTFDVCFYKEGMLIHSVYKNNLSGFKKLFKNISGSSHIVMEASGPYYVQLASYLYSRGVSVSVINPLKIKRYTQMRFYRAKTDKKDAQAIMEYGDFHQNDLSLWQPEPEAIHHIKQMRSAVELLQKQQQQSSRQLEAFTSTGNINKAVRKTLEKAIEILSDNILILEENMLSICQEYYKSTYDNLISIPSIGPKTAVMLIAITDNFTKFTHYKQLIAYVGFSPRIYQSGTSVKGRASICKMGKAQLRKLLYMCSWTAKKCNKACVEMYQRLKKKSKPERVIKIAIANKLLKQAFAIGKSNQKYIENYQPNICF